MNRLWWIPILGSAIATTLSAQTLTIRLLDGKTGRPIANKNVTIRWNPSEVSRDTIVRISKDGTGRIAIPNKVSSFLLMEGPKDGKEPERIAYLDCNGPIGARNSIAEVLSHGIVPSNTCSKNSVTPEPSVIVFWGLPHRWYEVDMQ